MLALKSGLGFFVSASEVPFFGTWKRALLVKVPIFKCQKSRFHLSEASKGITVVSAFLCRISDRLIWMKCLVDSSFYVAPPYDCFNRKQLECLETHNNLIHLIWVCHPFRSLVWCYSPLKMCIQVWETWSFRQILISTLHNKSRQFDTSDLSMSSNQSFNLMLHTS